MSTKTLRGFQEKAVESGVELFLNARDLLNAAGADAASRAAAINHNGYLLIEAPTGSGKTLMAGTMVEKFSHEEDVVWFWFAPFKGVTGQTAAFLREQFHGLRLRELADDREPGMSRRGDVFVTTWQTVATRVKDKRNVRKEGDTNRWMTVGYDEKAKKPVMAREFRMADTLGFGTSALQGPREPPSPADRHRSDVDAGPGNR